MLEAGSWKPFPSAILRLMAISDTYRRIWEMVERIPAGRVATYGQIAALVGRPGHARQVGYALHNLPEGTEVPWHRVINARGRVSPRSRPGWDGLQRMLLVEEGVTFDSDDRIDLERYRWEPGLRPDLE